MSVYYLAGPYTGRTPRETELNIRKAEDVSAHLWRVGIANVCPHTMTRHMVGVAPEATFLEGMIEIMSRCDEVLLLDGWRGSRGAVIECEKARHMRIPTWDGLAEFLSEVES